MSSSKEEKVQQDYLDACKDCYSAEKISINISQTGDIDNSWVEQIVNLMSQYIPNFSYGNSAKNKAHFFWFALCVLQSNNGELSEQYNNIVTSLERDNDDMMARNKLRSLILSSFSVVERGSISIKVNLK